MKPVILFLAAALLTGCATHSDYTIASVRASGVSERTVAKLEHHGSLTPNELIELRRHGVSDSVPLRQLDEDGVDYLVQRNDLRTLRSAGVRPVVTEALVDASDRFAADRAHHAYHASYYYDGPPWWYWLPAISVGYIWGGHYHHDHHDHGGHHHHH
jgi:hypothetical protein